MRVALQVPTLIVLLLNLYFCYISQSQFFLHPAWVVGAGINLVFLFSVSGKYFDQYKLPLLLAFLAWIVIVAALPRIPNAGFMDRFVMVQMFISVGLSLGVLLGDKTLRILYCIYFGLMTIAYSSVFSELKPTFSLSVAIPIAIFFAFAISVLVELYRLHIDIIEDGGYRAAFKRVLFNVVKPFQALRPIEWLGVFIIALSLLRLISDIAFVNKLLGSLYRVFISLYRNVVEFVPSIIIDEIFFLFNRETPSWLIPTLIIFGILIRAADLHSRKYDDVPLWDIILGKILYTAGNLTAKEKRTSVYTGKSVDAAVLFLNFMIVATAFSYHGINPIHYLAPNGGVSLQSVLFVCILGYITGAIAKSFQGIAYKLEGLSFWIVISIVLFFRGLFYGPALILITPFVAWRVLLLSLLICMLLIIFSTGIDLVRPPLPNQ